MVTTMSPVQDNVYRLPTDITPTHYYIVLQTDLDNLTFQGIVIISLDVKVETSKIVLNASELKLGKASITASAPGSKERRAQTIVSSSHDETYQRITYQLKKPIVTGAKALLSIRFSGIMNDSRRGYFKSAWTHNGVVKHYALTQLAAIAARKAFPCWDEPLFKATFAIIMVSAPDTVNLSNMPAKNEIIVGSDADLAPEVAEILADRKGGRWKITAFETTPPMSSYIVAYANGPFEFLETSVIMPLTGRTIPLRTYATPDMIHQTQFLLDSKAAVLPLYENTFNVEYPLPKLDTLVGHDFEGAMENWGLIIGSTQSFLLDPVKPTQEAKLTVFSVESHEVSHMWFGNVTTMQWWDTIYLNEGFATLMGELVVAKQVYPDWKLESQFITRHLNKALTLDAKLSSHAIEVEIPDANSINEIFDGLSYSKAGSVLRMLSEYVGEDKFLKGVSIYLNAHLFGNTVTSDLWEGVSAATGIDVAKFMANWIKNAGYPVLTVTESAEGIQVRQDRFLETGPANQKDNKTIWNIPLNLLTTQGGNTSVDKSIVLREREAQFELDTAKSFKLNAGTSGVYRVLYTPERLAKIAAEAAREQTIFSFDDRVGLVLDVFALSKAGLAKISSSLDLVDSWKTEKEYFVWTSVAESIEELISIWWENTEALDGLKRLQRTLFIPLVDKLGFDYSENDSRDTTLLRTLAITQAATAGDAGVTSTLYDRFKRYTDTGDESIIPSELQKITYAMAVRYGGRTEYNAIVKILEKRRTPSEEKAAIFAMGAPQDSNLLHETTAYIVNKSRGQDIAYFFRAMGANFAARRFATQFMMQNYDTLYHRVEEAFGLGDTITASLVYYSSQADYEVVETFFKTKDTSKYTQSKTQTLDTIKARSAYVERSTKDLLDWLNKH